MRRRLVVLGSTEEIIGLESSESASSCERAGSSGLLDLLLDLLGLRRDGLGRGLDLGQSLLLLSEQTGGLGFASEVGQALLLLQGGDGRGSAAGSQRKPTGQAMKEFKVSDEVANAAAPSRANSTLACARAHLGVVLQRDRTERCQ